MILYLKTSPQIGLNGKQNQPNHTMDIIESSPLSYFEKVEQGYYEFMKRNNLGIKFILNTSNFINIHHDPNHIIKKE